MMGGRSLPVYALLLSGVAAGNGNGNGNGNANRNRNRNNGNANGNANQNANRNANRNARTATRVAGQPTYYPTWEPTYMPTWMPTQGLGEEVALGDLCRTNENCHSGNCYFGPFNNQDEGICQCSFVVKTSCSGGRCAKGPTAGKGNNPNVCVDFPNGAVCKADAQCLSRSCWLGGAGKAKVGECQCETCAESGCSSCPTGEHCPMTTNSKPKVCLPWAAIPTESPAAIPTESPSAAPVPMELGRACQSDGGCASGSCYMEEGAVRGICHCSRQVENSCGGGRCTSPVRGGLKECVDVPKGRLCLKDENCESSSCHRGAAGTNLHGTCQCQECTERGCSVCGFRQVCKHSKNSVPNECVTVAAPPVKPKTRAPTETSPKTPAPTVQPEIAMIKTLPPLVQIKTLPPCADTPDYADPRFQWSCAQFGTLGCAGKLLLFGFSAEAVAEIRAHCRKSCDACDDPTAVLATGAPTAAPTGKKTRAPTAGPTPAPTDTPTRDPTSDPTKEPTRDPTKEPTRDPTEEPTHDPTKGPTRKPSRDPTFTPTNMPTLPPTLSPTAALTDGACADTPGFVNPTFNFGCQQFGMIGCDKMTNLIGAAEMAAIHANCRESCGTCPLDTAAPTATPTRAPTATPCVDTPGFVYPAWDFGCLQFGLLGCDKLAKFHLGAAETAAIHANCRESCGTCGAQTAAPTAAPILTVTTFTPTATPTTTPTTVPTRDPTEVPTAASCKDTPQYRDARLNFSCSQLAAMGCDKLALFMYSEAEAAVITSNCQQSCGACPDEHDDELDADDASYKPQTTAPPNLDADDDELVDNVGDADDASYKTDGPAAVPAITPVAMPQGKPVRRRRRPRAVPVVKPTAIPVAKATPVPVDPPTAKPVKATAAPTDKLITGPGALFTPCGHGASCQSGACFLGMGNTLTVGQCQCRECHTNGCGGCKEGTHCKMVNPRVTNMCVKYIRKQAVALKNKDTDRTVKLEKVCTEDEECVSGSCYRGKFGKLAVGVCQCTSEVADICGAGTCRVGRSGAKSMCVERGMGETCWSDQNCASRSCYRGASNFAREGVCQCRTCHVGGCGGCADHQTCPSDGDASAKRCADITASPTLHPTKHPTVTKTPTTEPTKAPTRVATPEPTARATPKEGSVRLGEYCTRSLQCRSGSCFRPTKKCHCRYLNSGGYGDGCLRTEICRSREGKSNICKPRPTESPTAAPTKVPDPVRTVRTGERCLENRWCFTNSCFIRSGRTAGICECMIRPDPADNGCRGREVCKRNPSPTVINQCVAKTQSPTEKPTRAPRKKPTPQPTKLVKNLAVGAGCKRHSNCRS